MVTSKEKGGRENTSFNGSVSPYDFGRKRLNYFSSCVQGGLKR